jgi:hypothetical protein
VRAWPSSCQLQLSTSAGCGLAIAGYPRFRYDARGGGGLGSLGAADHSGRQALVFAPASLVIPPLSWRTTRVLGLPLPPGVTIRIEPEDLAGHWDPATASLELRFRARFHCSFAGLYQPSVLQIDTVLSNAAAQGLRHRATGRPLGADGQALLVGVATVPPSGDPWLDRFLGLPDEALAMLRCSFVPVP